MARSNSAPHSGVFRVECCGSRRLIINGIIVCRHCDSSYLLPNAHLSQLVPPALHDWAIVPKGDK